jgi:CDGSH-type Zn-finger protein
MTAPVRAADTPFAVEVGPGKEYYWCACGLSKNQPFCDGSHKATDITPLKYTTNDKKTAYFCGCKATKNRPLCDGTHKKV